MSQHFKISLSLQGIQSEVQYKEKFHKLLAAVTAKYPLLVNKDVFKEKNAQLEVKDETLFVKINLMENMMIDLDHIIDHVQYGINSIIKDLRNCIDLMKNHTGPSFEASIEKMKLQEADNVVLDILSNPPISTNTNLVLWPLEHFSFSLLDEAKTSRFISILEEEIVTTEDQVTLCD